MTMINVKDEIGYMSNNNILIQSWMHSTLLGKNISEDVQLSINRGFRTPKIIAMIMKESMPRNEVVEAEYARVR